MAAGVIPDPYLDGNEAALSWMYDIDWRYAARLDADALDLRPPGVGERVDLVFDGIDTVGDRTAGGRAGQVELGRTYNMHRSYRFDIRHTSRGRPLTLEVDLHSATAYAEAERQRLGRPARGVLGAVQLHPQDGLQLRLGLGARPAYRRHLAAGPAASAGASPGWRRCGPWSPSTAPAPAGRGAGRRRAPGRAGAADGCAADDRRPPSRERRCLLAPRARRRLSSRCPTRRCGGPSATASSRCPTSRSPCQQPDQELDAGSAGSGSAPSSSTPPATRRHRVHLRRQRPAGVRQGRQLDPRRRLPDPDHPRAARRAGSTRPSTPT